jgi:serine/threonine protein kinase
VDELAHLPAAGLDLAVADAHLSACPACRQRVLEQREHLKLAEELRGAISPPGQRIVIDASTRDGVDPPSSVLISFSANAADREHIPGYDIVREVSDGGQGVVYEAIQHATGATVAVKVLKGGILAGDRAKWRFEREIRLVASLRHPHIVVIHDSGIAHGQYYYAMDYVRGHPLDTHIRLAHPGIKGIARLMRAVCDAVGYAHQRGVIHRDLKPSNVLVSEAGSPCVLDFGLAKIIGDEQDGRVAMTVTAPGMLLGTLPFLSPEQTMGNPDEIDTRSDVYTLGVMLYRLLTGKPPYATDTDVVSACKAIRDVDPPRPSHVRNEINSDLDAIILKCMEKDPNRRYATAVDLRSDLDAWLEGRPIAARSASSL